MGQPRVLILRAAGVNCEIETAHAWALAGAVADVRHINELRANPRQLHEYQILTIPGGFSYGDDISAGKILANELLMFLGEFLREFAARERLILGICNGFQVLCKAGLLPGGHQDADLPLATITANLSGKYEDRWVHLARSSEKCIFLSQARAYELPVAHGEGRVVTSTEQGMREVTEQGCVALRYQAPGGGSASYPDNPNGSMSDVAGLCDPSGRIFGLMPHPERFIHHTQHPEWTSRESNLADGLSVFASAVAFFK